MNKDVIYVEPENDITDIITKIEHSPEKIVVLVPPKKAGVFRSVVNIKLIARAANNSEKTVVLVTVDPSIIKLAAASRIPVTKDLKTPPVVPKLEEEDLSTSETEIIDDVDEDEVEEPDGTKLSHRHEEIVAKDAAAEAHAEEVAAEEPEEEKPEEDKKAKKAPKNGKSNKFLSWVKAHKVPVAIGGVAVVAAIAFLIWAFGFAPAVTVAVEIQTETKSFAENVKFTTSASDEDAKAGIFYIQEKQVQQSQEVKFQATGKKNVGETASGTATVYATLSGSNPQVSVNKGDTFSVNGLVFQVTEGTTLSPDDAPQCSDLKPSELFTSGCNVQGNIKVAATAPGAQYNINQENVYIGLPGVSSCSIATSGGTDKEVSIVEQIDVEKAKDQMKASNEQEIKDKLLSEVGNDMMAIESSYSIETGSAEATPGVGQEVGEGVQPVLKAVTTAKIYTIDKSKLEEFIEEKANVPDDQKVYEVKDSFIENFSGANGSYSGRLKANYNVGPKVTDEEVAEMIKGKGLGDVQHELKNITGVVGVTIDKSYPWVTSVPGDTNKITVNIQVRENGDNSSNSGNGGNNGGGQSNSNQTEGND